MGDLATMFHPLRDDACAAQRLEQLLHGPLPLRTVVHLQGSTTSPHLGFPLCEVTNLHRLDTSLPVYPPGQSLSAFVRGQRSLVGRNGFRAVQRRGLTGCSLGKLAGPEVAHALLLLQCLGFALFARKLGPVEQPYGRLWGSLFTELFATVLVHAIFIAAHAQDEVGSVLARIAAEGAHPELAHGGAPLPLSPYGLHFVLRNRKTYSKFLEKAVRTSFWLSRWMPHGKPLAGLCGASNRLRRDRDTSVVV